MTGEPAQLRDQHTERVRELVWKVRSRLEGSHLRMGEVSSYLEKLEQRRQALRARVTPLAEPVLEDALGELDSTQEEIRVVGEEMDRRSAQLLEWETDAADKLRFHRRLMESAPMGFFLTDENGMIADANEEAARMLNVPPAYLRNKPIVNFVSRRDVGNARSFVRAVGRGEQVLENVIVFRPRRGGAVRVTEVRACALVRDRERAIGWLVREVRTSDDADAAAMETAAERPSSHELREPIQMIERAVSLLRTALPEGPEGTRGQHQCDVISQASAALSQVANDLET